MSSKSGASAEALPLPKGGGSTRGLGDGFTPDLNRGTGSYAIEIETPKGYRELTARLALTYNSGAGDGPFGFGWSLPSPRIQIDTDRGVADYLTPQYLMDGETLIEVGDGMFRQRVENAFHRIRRVGEGWEVSDRSGNVTILGETADARITGQVLGAERTFAWFAEVVRDASGNEISYTYLRDGDNLYLSRINYAQYQVHLEYEERHDVTVNRRPGFPVTQRLRCREIAVHRPADPHPVIRRYRLHYADDADAPSLLVRVTMEGFKRQPDGSMVRTEAPSVELSYTPFEPERRRYQRVASDLLDPPGPLGEDGRELVDLDGDALPDVVQLGTGRPRVWRNTGGGSFAPPQVVENFPHPMAISAPTVLFDADGSGTADVVSLEPRLARYYPNAGDGSFERPRFLGGRRPLAFDPTDEDSAFADVNGDGRVDLVKTTARGLVMWRNRGGDEGFDLPTVTPRTADRNESPDARLSDPSVFVTDVTGDGLPDIVHVVSGLVEYWPSLGGGRYDRRQTMDDPPRLPRHHDPSRLFMSDTDGTGTSDVIYVDRDRVFVWRNLGGVRFAPPVEVTGVPSTSVDSIRLVDLLGSGSVGVLWSGVRAGRGSTYRYLSLTDVKPFLLTTVREGTGLETQIEYGSSSAHALRDAEAGAPWRTLLPIPVQVVERITQRDVVTGVEDTSEIFYHDGRWDPETRRFRGFGRGTVRRVGGPDADEVYEEHRYLVGAPDEPSIDPGGLVSRKAADLARRGQMFLTTYFAAGRDSAPLRTEETGWEIEVVDHGLDGTPVLFPKVVSTEVRNFEEGNHPRVVTTEYEYDGFGNVTGERRTGRAPTGDDDGNPVQTLVVVTEVEYAQNPDRHLVDRVARVVRRNEVGDVLAEVRHYYDGPELEGLPLGEVEAGLLVRQEAIVMPRAEAAALYGVQEPDWPTLGYHETERVDGVPSLAVNQTRYAHSGQGMITRRVDALGAETVFEYDDEGLLVVRMTNAAGHVRTASWDASWQVIEEHTTASGTATRYTYDGLGRVVTVTSPGDTPELPTLRYTRDHTTLPTSLHIEKRKQSGADDVYEKVIYYDAFGREIQERSRVDENRVRVSGVVGQNQRGDPVYRGLPLFRNGLDFEGEHELPETARFTYRYDGIGRVIAATNPDGHTYEVSYTPWTAVHRDVIDTLPGHPHAETPRIQHFDVFGRLSGVTLTGDGGTSHRASYTYDLLGRLVASTDLEGRPALRSVRYDGRGARLRIEHVTAGTRTAIYDGPGRLVKYWDDRDMPVERTFDAIGRLLTESVEGVVQETYHYDLQPDQNGRLGRVDDKGGTVMFAYDVRGRVSAKTRTIHGTAYNVEYGYDPAGMQNRLVFPNGTEFTFERWGDGRIRRVDGFVDEMEYEDTGRLSSLHHANGIDESLAYDAAGYLSSLRATRGTETFYDAQLTHDPAGRLVHSEELSGAEARVEDFGHDALGRLIEFERSQGSESTRWEYAYDADGNLLRADEMDVSEYRYDFSAPGALTERTLGDGTVEEVRFDTAGHATALGDMSMEFDARGRLVRVTKDDGTVVEITYDYRGARLAKRVSGPGGTVETRYVDEIYEDRAGVATGYVFAAKRLVGHVRGGGRRHLHTDHRGSVVLVTRPNGAVDGRGWFGPYGSADTLADPEGSRQYTGAVFDPETGLYYLNLRFYSPALGRFLSPDPRFLGKPEQELEVAEAHNLYVYANGDPMDYIDPTGQGFWSTLGKVLAAIVVVVAVIAAVAVAVWAISAAGGLMLAGAAIGAIIGGIADGWQGAALGAMMGATIGINLAIAGPLGIITFLGVFPGIREKSWYKSLAGWTSWLMPASWPGHIMGLGVFLGNGIAHLFGSDKQIESMKFDWKHGQILTAGGEYGGTPFPWLGLDGPSHNLGGFSFWSNDTWAEGGGSWRGIYETVNSGRGFAHETGHMLSNALFGFWQGIVNGIENLTTEEHDDRFFEKIAQSNVEESDRDPGDQVIPIWG